MKHGPSPRPELASVGFVCAYAWLLPDADKKTRQTSRGPGSSNCHSSEEWIVSWN